MSGRQGAFEAGCDAYHRCRPWTDNPYDNSEDPDALCHFWHVGWHRAAAKVELPHEILRRLTAIEERLPARVPDLSPRRPVQACTARR